MRTRRVYDLISAIYPLSTLFFHSRAHRVAVSLAGIESGMNVLEVATGSGEMFRRLVRANPGGITCGLDLSPNMAARTQRIANRRIPNTRAHCQAVDARSMPFKDGAFDAVVCCYLLELLSEEDIVRTLSEMRRILRPHGRVSLVLIGQQLSAFNAWYRFISSLLPAFLGRQTASIVPDLLEACDFQIEHDQNVRQGCYPSRVIVARK